MLTPESSDIVSVDFAPDKDSERTGTLTVEFKRNKKIARYYDVPQEIYLAIIKSESVGSAFHALVRNASYAWEYLATRGNI